MVKYILIYYFFLIIISILGLVWLRKHLLLLLVLFEVILIAVYVSFGIYCELYSIFSGNIIAFTLLVLGAVETAFGLTLLVRYYRLNGTILLDSLSKIRELNFLIKN